MLWRKIELERKIRGILRKRQVFIFNGMVMEKFIKKDFCTKILRRRGSKPCGYLRQTILGRGKSKCKGPELQLCLQCSEKLRTLLEDEVRRVWLGKGKPHSL